MSENKKSIQEHSENKRLVQLARKANQEKSEAHAKENLKRHITSKFRTTMIGALSKFENSFGYLWGHGLHEDEKTKEERKFAEMWQLVRTEVLNNGNNQLRAALQEIDQHTVSYIKWEYDFPIKKEKQNE